MAQKVVEIADSLQIMEEEGLEIENPIIIEGFPSVGMVGTISAEFLARRAMDMEEVGHIKSRDIIPISLIEKGIPRRPIRIFRKENLLVLASDIVIKPKLVYPLAEVIVDWAKSKDAQKIISLGAFLRKGKEKGEKRKVYGIGTNQQMINEIKEANANLFNLGAVAGLPGILLVECTERNVPAIGLFSEARFNYPDPEAAAEVLKVLSKITKKEINVDPLFEMAEKTKKRMSKLLKKYKKAMGNVHKEKKLLYG